MSFGVEELARELAELIQPGGERGLDAATAAADIGNALAREVDLKAVLAGGDAFALVERLDRIAWDVVLHAAERATWSLSTARREDALRTFAVAFGTFPFPAGGEKDVAALRCRRALVRAPGEGAEDAFLSAARETEWKSRWMTLLPVVPLLTGDRRRDAVREALNSAFEFPDPVHAGQAVAAVVVRDEAALLDETLTRARSAWSDPDCRATLITELAWTLTLERVERLFDEIETLEDEWQRATALIEVGQRAPHLRNPRWAEIAATIEDEDTRPTLESEIMEIAIPSPDASSLYAAINAWLRVARARAESASEIAGAIVEFVAKVTALYARATSAAGR
jgi:hypothetical protein